MSIRVAFSTLACPRWSWREIAERGSLYGYDGVEIRLIEGQTDFLQRPEFAPAARKASRSVFEDLGLAICGLASSVCFDAADATERHAQELAGREYVALANEMGASFVRVFGDVLPAGHDPALRNAALGQIADGLNQLGEFARQFGIDILIETHGDFSDTRLLCELMSRVESSQVGVLWDTHHPWRFHGESLAETATRLWPWNRHTHWKDSVARGERPRTSAELAAADEARKLMSGHREADYVLFGDGEFPAAECMRVLTAGGYAGWFSLEWEKAWHPEIADPQIALPPFPARLRRLARGD